LLDEGAQTRAVGQTNGTCILFGPVRTKLSPAAK